MGDGAVLEVRPLYGVPQGFGLLQDPVRGHLVLGILDSIQNQGDHEAKYKDADRQLHGHADDPAAIGYQPSTTVISRSFSP